MSQGPYIRDVLSTWEMSNCRPVMVPGQPTKVELPEQTEEDTDPEDVQRAQKLAGSLIWLSTRTRPDISYAQSRISSMATKNPKDCSDGRYESTKVFTRYQGRRIKF